MRIFILKFDDTVEVTESFTKEPYYVHKNYPKGQIFCQNLIGDMGHTWSALHRDYKGDGPRWVFAETHHVPKEVQFARMLVD